MLGRQRVQASRDHGLDRLGQRQVRIRREAKAVIRAYQEAAVQQQAHVLFRVQRVAADRPDDAGTQVRRQFGVEEVGDESTLACPLRQGRQAIRRSRSPSLAAVNAPSCLVEQLGPGRGRR